MFVLWNNVPTYTDVKRLVVARWTYPKHFSCSENNAQTVTE